MHQVVERVEHAFEMDESLNLHKTGWTVQRIGWTSFLLIFILSLLALLGNGILSHRKSETAGNMVEYERYGRFENSTNLHFVANSENGQAVLHIPQEYLQNFELEHITPQPDKQMAADGHYVYTFLAEAPVHILMRGVPKKRGNVEAVVRINNTRLTLSQYIFP
jgi:hypothetical protein